MRINLLYLLILLSLATFSQDTLFTKDGRTIPARVLEVSAHEVQYKSATDNTEKQISVIDISSLNSIHYANGTEDIFLSENESGNKVADNAQIEKLPDPDPTYDKRIARNEAIANAAFFGLRVLGFACRVALEIALMGCGGSHHSSHDSHSSGTYGKRGN